MIFNQIGNQRLASQDISGYGRIKSMVAVDRSIQMAEQNNSELIVVNVLRLPIVSHYTAAVLNSQLGKVSTRLTSGLKRSRDELRENE